MPHTHRHRQTQTHRQTDTDGDHSGIRLLVLAYGFCATALCKHSGHRIACQQWAGMPCIVSYIHIYICIVWWGFKGAWPRLSDWDIFIKRPDSQGLCKEGFFMAKTGEGASKGAGARISSWQEKAERKQLKTWASGKRTLCKTHK